MVGTVPAPPSPPTWTLAQFCKATFFAGLTVASVAADGPAPGLYGRCLAGCVACTLPGLFDPHLAQSYGYGTSLALQAALYARHATAVPSRLLLLAYVLYGLKVCVFQALRDVRPEYVAKALADGRNTSPRGFRASSAST